jgi:hypothetical protein
MSAAAGGVARTRPGAWLAPSLSWIGWAVLGATLAYVLFLPNGWIAVGLAAAATVLLALDPRLGPLPAAMLVMLAIPMGRGSEVGLPTIAGNPVRPHDVAAVIGIVGGLAQALPRLGSRGRLLATRPIGVALLVFLGVGMLATAVGIGSDNALRDVVRDVRWWGLYVVGLLALLAGTPRPAVVRALMWGMTLYSALLVMGMLMPDFEGGLKIGAYAYDQRMRLHYGQAVFLVPAVAFAATRAIRGSRQSLGAAMLLGAAAGLTLTRALMVEVVVLGTVAGTWAAYRRWGRSWRSALGSASVAAVVLLGIGAGLGAYTAGIHIWAPPPGSVGGSRNGPNPDSRPVINSIDRITGQEGSDLAAQAGGRLLSYADAFIESSDSPVLGHGMGELAKIGWAWGGYRTSTVGSQPGVDDAYLTAALKAGGLGVAALAALLLWPLRQFLGRMRERTWTWLLPAWIGLLGLTLIESFAVSGYAPYAFSLMVVLPSLSARRPSSSAR